MKKRNFADIISIIILMVAVMIAYQFYQSNNFNDFAKAEKNLYTSNFSRDTEITYNQKRSYKIESNSLNDAMIIKEISIQKDCIYKVSCMVKTQDVNPEKEHSEIGAHLSIADSMEKSKSIIGTQDWTRITLYFDSKDRESVKLGFRLGGYDGDCTGSAWFSDLKIEEARRSEDTNWNFACFIIENTNVTIGDQKIKTSMTDTNIEDMNKNMERFKNSCKELSGNNMTVDYDVFNIKEAITSLSYDEENGYYVSPGDVKNLIDSYLEKKEYDHIFVCVSLGDILYPNDVEVNDWIGLRGNGLFRNWIF